MKTSRREKSAKQRCFPNGRTSSPSCGHLAGPEKTGKHTHTSFIIIICNSNNCVVIITDNHHHDHGKLNQKVIGPSSRPSRDQDEEEEEGPSKTEKKKKKTAIHHNHCRCWRCLCWENPNKLKIALGLLLGSLDSPSSVSSSQTKTYHAKSGYKTKQNKTNLTWNRRTLLRGEGENKFVPGNRRSRNSRGP